MDIGSRLRKMRLDSLSFRLTAAAAVWIAIVLAAGGVLLSSLFTQSVERTFDDRLTGLLEALIATTELSDTGELVRERTLNEARFDLAFSGWYWQVGAVGAGQEGAGSQLRSRSLWDQTLTLPSHSAPQGGDGVYRAFVGGPDGQRLRVLERRVLLPGASETFAFAVGATTREMERDIGKFNGLLAGALAVLGTGILIGLLIQVRFGLRPLERARQSLADIRSGRANRLTGIFPAEIEPLASEINTLIAHSNEVVERARTQAGNLAHALKTPLSILKNESRNRDGDFGEIVDRQVDLMREQIDRHLARARTAASAKALGASVPAAPVIDRLMRTIGKIYADKNLTFEQYLAKGAAFRGEVQDLEEMLGNLLDNAGKWARSRIRVTIGQETQIDQTGRALLNLSVEDDGPGLPADARARALRRGERLDETVPGSGLGLSIVGEICELYGGRIALDTSDLGGLKATLILPAAPFLNGR